MTILTPEPQKPSASATLLSVLVMIPAITGSYASYRVSQRDTEGGYKALVKTTVDLQAEVLRLHDQNVVLQERNALLTDKVDLQGKQLDKLLSDLKVAVETGDGDGIHVETPVPAPPMPAAMPQHTYKPEAPPATLQQAVQEQEKL